EPDLVVNTGDSIAHRDAVGPFLDALGPLLERPGVFVYGSNDLYSPTPKNPTRYLWRTSASDHRHGPPDLPWAELGAGMTAAGWLDANNRRGRIKAGHIDIEVGGVHDSHIDSDRYDLIAGPTDPGADLRLGVLHSPEPQILDAFIADGYDLLLAGHTHGGQVCLPGIGALVTNCGIDRTRAHGLHRHPPDGSCTFLQGSALHHGHPPGSAAGQRQRCSRWYPRSARVIRRSAGCGAAWQRASFGTKRPPVQIRPPRPGFRRSHGIPVSLCHDASLPVSDFGSDMGADLDLCCPPQCCLGAP